MSCQPDPGLRVADLTLGRVGSREQRRGAKKRKSSPVVTVDYHGNDGEEVGRRGEDV